MQFVNSYKSYEPTRALHWFAQQHVNSIINLFRIEKRITNEMWKFLHINKNRNRNRNAITQCKTNSSKLYAYDVHSSYRTLCTVNHVLRPLNWFFLKSIRTYLEVLLQFRFFVHGKQCKQFTVYKFTFYTFSLFEWMNCSTEPRKNYKSTRWTSRKSNFCKQKKEWKFVCWLREKVFCIYSVPSCSGFKIYNKPSTQWAMYRIQSWFELN